MRLLRFLLPLLLVPHLALAYAVPLSATTTTGTIFAFPTLVNNTYPDLMSPFFYATSTTAHSTFPNASTTAFSATTICLTGDTCRTTWPTGSGSFGYPFYKFSTFGTTTSATSSSLYTAGAFFASSTLASQLPYASSTALSAGGLFAATPTTTVTSVLTIVPNANGIEPFYIGTSTTGCPIYGCVQGDIMDAELNFNGNTGINVVNDNQGTCASEGFWADGNIPTLNNNYAFFGFLNVGWTGSGCAMGNGVERPLDAILTNPTGGLDFELASTTQVGWNFYGKNNVLVATLKNDTGNFGLSTSTPGSTLSVQGNEFIAGNITSTSTLASVFPYASSTGITTSYASTTDLLVSGATTFGKLASGAAKILQITSAGVLQTLTIPLTEPNGGTNRSSVFPASMLVAQNGAGNALESTSTPTADHYLATSTNASIFPYASTTALTAVTASTTNLYVSGAINALALMGTDGLLGKYAGASACSANNFVTTISAVGGTTCGTATISGVNLGSNLNSHSVSGSITGTSYNGSASVSDWTLNMANANTWTAVQTFKTATSTNLGASSFFEVPGAATPANVKDTELTVNTTSASTSLAYGSHQVYATSTMKFAWATSTPSTAATDTEMWVTGPRGEKYTSIGCGVSGGGTATVAIGSGTATSTYFPAKALSSVVVPITLSANNSFDQFKPVFVAIGTYTGTANIVVSCGLGREYSY